MEREEPTVNPVDLRDVEFRPRRGRTERTITRPKEDGGLIWKIAGGVFIGLVLFFGLQRCVDEYRARQAIEAMNAELAKIEAQAHEQRELMIRHARERQAKHARIEAALQPRANERCINGRRFRRVPNGWEQLPHNPCK